MAQTLPCNLKTASELQLFRFLANALGTGYWTQEESDNGNDNKLLKREKNIALLWPNKDSNPGFWATKNNALPITLIGAILTAATSNHKRLNKYVWMVNRARFTT